MQTLGILRNIKLIYTLNIELKTDRFSSTKTVFGCR